MVAVSALSGVVALFVRDSGALGFVATAAANLVVGVAVGAAVRAGAPALDKT